MTSAGTTPPSSHTSNPPPLTDADIIHLAQEQPQTVKAPPPDFLCPDSHQTLISYLRSRSASPSASSAVAEYTIALLSIISLSPHFPSRSSLVSSLLLAYIDLFNAHKIPHDSNSLKTIQLFTLHITNIPVKELASAAELIVDNFGEITDPDDAQFLDLLPTCLVLILRSNEIAKGQEFVELTLQRIVTSSWSNALLVKMVSVTRDFLFTDKNWRREFVDKVFHGMNGVDLQDVPSLIYQLLVAASKGFCKRKVIEGIVMFFGSRMDLKVTSAMRQVEGTILLHVNFAVKQDPSLGQEVVGLLKSDPRALNNFTLAILLSIARVRRFNESCMRVLKTTVLSAYQDYKVARNCKWMPNNVKKEYLQYVKIVEKEILRSANDTSYGREYVVPSIIQFGFLLLELVDEGNSMLSDKSDDVLGFEKLGIEILKMLFEAHDMSRTEIIDQCKFRILSLRPEQGQSIIRLLSFVVSSYPYTMLEHVSRLKDLLDYFSFMNNNIATYLITALLPLTKFSRDLQDYIILVVRKAMFSREYTVQVSAINAVVDLILADKRPRKGAPICLHESSSQASCSQQGETACGKNAGLFTELSGLLQRSLYQQAKVKEIMYHGLVKLVSVDPLTAGPIFDFLLPHFLRFFREDGDVGLNISSCVKLDSGKLCIDEPLDCLLSCISWILLLQPHGKNGNSSEPWPCFDFSLSQDNEAGRIISGDLFSRSLQKIRKLLRNGQMEVLLGEVQDLGSASLGEEQKQCYASIISGIFEVFLNDIAAELEKSDDAQKVGLEKEIIDFVNLLESLREDARQSRPGHGVRRGNSKPTAGDIKFAHPSLSFWGTSSIYQLLLSAIKSFEVNCSDKRFSSHGRK
ncbi:hypothetical protein Dimus_029394 [Dionaea muscipula]